MSKLSGTCSATKLVELHGIEKHVCGRKFEHTGRHRCAFCDHVWESRKKKVM